MCVMWVEICVFIRGCVVWCVVCYVVLVGNIDCQFPFNYLPYLAGQKLERDRKILRGGGGGGGGGRGTRATTRN